MRTRNRYTDATIYESDAAETKRDLVVEAVKRNKSLRWSDLIGADLSGLDLRRSDFSNAGLSGANLSLANLRDADLSDADLSGAKLSGVDLIGAYMKNVVVDYADLRQANLEPIKQDLIAEVLRLPNELEALREAIVAGRIDGSTYSGECAGLAGTLARAHGESEYHGEFIQCNGFSFRAQYGSPRERWFLMIKPGDTPETNPFARLALEWVDKAIAIRDNIRATAPK